jgi:membrane-bound lytic murein transglycosylase B
LGFFCLLLLMAWLNAARAQGTEKKQNITSKSAQQAQKKSPKRAKTVAHKRTQRPHNAANAVPLNSNPEVAIWAQDAARRLQIDPLWAQTTIDQAQRLPLVEKWVLPPASPVAKDWGAYRARFIEPVRIQAGLRFWAKHQATLERAEREYGVPASLIVGIIGV